MSHDNDLELATDLARQAGEAIRSVRTRARLRPIIKADQSPVTEADLAADEVIRRGLETTGDFVVTEESFHGSVVGQRHRVWFVDPIDGTDDFIAGREDYVVQIGLVVDGVPVVGVLYQPETDVLWRSVVPDLRCERIDSNGRVQTLSVPHIVPPERRPRVAVSVSHPSRAVDFVIGELGAVSVLRGSVGLKVALILEDAADAYVTASRRIKVWDTAAPAAVLLAAGGVATSLGGAALDYSGPVAHSDGVLFWTNAVRNRWSDSLQSAMNLYRRRRALE